MHPKPEEAKKHSLPELSARTPAGAHFQTSSLQNREAGISVGFKPSSLDAMLQQGPPAVAHLLSLDLNHPPRAMYLCFDPQGGTTKKWWDLQEVLKSFQTHMNGTMRLWNLPLSLLCLLGVRVMGLCQGLLSCCAFLPQTEKQ